LAQAEQLRDDWETTPDGVWLSRVEPELGNFRAALGWALGAHGDVLLGQRLAGALDTVWRYFPTEGRRWVQAAEQRVAADTPASVLAALDLAEAQLLLDFNHLLDLNQRKASLQAGERALARYCELADPRGTAQSKLQIGRTKIYLGEIVEGEALTEHVLETARALASRRMEIYALQSLAFAREFVGDLSGARQRYTEALATARAVGAERSVALVAMNLAEAEFRGGNVHAALCLADEALPILALGDTRLVSTGRSNLAAYLVALRRFDDARVVAREAVSASRDAEFSVGVVLALQHLAAIGALRPETDARELTACHRAARIIGYVDTRLAALEAQREYTEQQEYDAMIPAMSNALGEKELSKLLAEGSAWSEDQVVAEAMLI
jgi:tetratricopeptide (TPR) repeat protein